VPGREPGHGRGEILLVAGQGDRHRGIPCIVVGRLFIQNWTLIQDGGAEQHLSPVIRIWF